MARLLKRLYPPLLVNLLLQASEEKLTAAGMTDRNEALGLIHLQESIPWQWGDVTPVGGVVPDALKELSKSSHLAV